MKPYLKAFLYLHPGLVPGTYKLVLICTNCRRELIPSALSGEFKHPDTDCSYNTDGEDNPFFAPVVKLNRCQW